MFQSLQVYGRSPSMSSAIAGKSPTPCTTEPVRHRLPCVHQDLDQGTPEVAVFVPIKEAGCSTLVAHSSSSTNSVDIFLDLPRHIVIDNMHDTLDIQSPGSYSGRHQNWHFPFSEVIKGLFPLALQPIAMDTCGWKPLFA